MLRAIREGYRVLGARGIPVIPASHRIVQWLPEPLLLVIMRRMVESDETSIKIGHAVGARAEMKRIAEELRARGLGAADLYAPGKGDSLTGQFSIVRLARSKERTLDRASDLNYR